MQTAVKVYINIRSIFHHLNFLIHALHIINLKNLHHEKNSILNRFSCYIQ